MIYYFLLFIFIKICILVLHSRQLYIAVKRSFKRGWDDFSSTQNFNVHANENGGHYGCQLSIIYGLGDRPNPSF